jgi:hypothetical protein
VPSAVIEATSPGVTVNCIFSCETLEAPARRTCTVARVGSLEKTRSGSSSLTCSGGDPLHANESKEQNNQGRARRAR